MPDTKISALAAVGAAADAQEFPVNDAGATKKITLGVVDAYILRALHVPSTALAANSVTDTKLRDSAGTSVIGKAGAGAGDPADIVAGADNQIFGRRGGALTFASVATAELAANILSADAAGRGKMQNGFFDAATVTAKFAAGSVTATEIANRSRTFLVPAVGGYDTAALEGSAFPRFSPAGWMLTDGQLRAVVGEFMVPADFVSNMTVAAVVYPLANGNCYNQGSIQYGAAGQAYSTHSDAIALAATAVTANQYCVIRSTALSAEAIGDYVSLWFERDATNILDTVGNAVYFRGWLVTYTADS
jgi:hypothetical protein